MIQKGNFIVLERDEFRDWLKKQSITRVIDSLQVHHTWEPSYDNFKGSNHFQMLEGMRTSHLKRGFDDIAQQLTTFPDGKIGYSIKRPFNKAPAGIKGDNANGLCIENIGNFNSGGDTLSAEQKKTIIHLYACLAEKLKLSVNAKHITYHCWWTADGTYIGDYDIKRSAKTCPGDKWWGDGHSLAAAKKNFLPQIQAELNRLKGILSLRPLILLLCQ
ncbi:peptidoglycan recognition protein family protein [Saccharibacillus brassicae]|uniref:peptidoglycan recognition protein family protein n=1 Tax=Saccharibacillus brassicae TaxID=2583377 RepID=UPI0014789B00|nr:N-acetylmuramoyl-L-alanine amidase [Saccharibacillus brassicae]